MPGTSTSLDTPACLIDGTWIHGGGEALASLNPVDEDAVTNFRTATHGDVSDAVSAARRAAPRWAKATGAERGRLLLEVAAQLEATAPELVGAVVAEVGKPLREAREEVDRGVAILRYHAMSGLDPNGAVIPNPNGDGLVFTMRDPLGVVGLITPWNFPVAIPLWKLAPALAYGNAVIWKPAPAATGVAIKLATLFQKLLPPGVVNLVPGAAETGSALAHAAVHGLSFTGSSENGFNLAQELARTDVRFQAELGGKNASIILADADHKRAASTVVHAAMGFAGQKCTATSRLIVETPVLDEVTALVVHEIRSLRVGLPNAADTDVGPMINRDAVSRVEGFLDRAVAGGAVLLAGGSQRRELGATFFDPTLVGNTRPDSELATTEVFGPVLCIFSAANADEALELANSSRYGLAAAIFTSDLEKGLWFSRNLEAGIVRVNGPTPGVVFSAPFGPRKSSGIGLPEQGKAAQDFFTTEKTVSIAS
jgi:acyl-CoA reductase-like NAD-dependent aldehyde dehydrogenase